MNTCLTGESEANTLESYYHIECGPGLKISKSDFGEVKMQRVLY